jgi:VWFA-related protein
MRTTFLLVTFALALAVVRIPQQNRSAQAQGATPGAEAQLLELDAVAVDSRGKPVTDLKPDDVEVWLESYRLPLESITALSEYDERRQRSITLILDDITITPDMVPRIRRAATQALERVQPGDRLAVTLLSAGGLVTTSDPAATRQAIDRFNARATTPLRPDDLAVHVFATLTNIARQASEAPGHRKTVIGIGPGWVFDTPIPPPSVSRNLREEWTTALRAMARSNVALYVVDPGGVGSSPVMGGAAGLARDTGGHAFVNTNDVATTIDRIMDEASSFYILRFADPPFFRTAPLRKIDLRTRRTDVTLRARRLLPGSLTK